MPSTRFTASTQVNSRHSMARGSSRLTAVFITVKPYCRYHSATSSMVGPETIPRLVKLHIGSKTIHRSRRPTTVKQWRNPGLRSFAQPMLTSPINTTMAWQSLAVMQQSAIGGSARAPLLTLLPPCLLAISGNVPRRRSKCETLDFHRDLERDTPLFP